MSNISNLGFFDMAPLENFTYHDVIKSHYTAKDLAHFETHLNKHF